jgi:hypothetical protein
MSSVVCHPPGEDENVAAAAAALGLEQLELIPAGSISFSRLDSELMESVGDIADVAAAVGMLTLLLNPPNNPLSGALAMYAILLLFDL